jgi:hypothetical protein
VAKYDAFGREIGEDTLSGLGGGSPVATPAQPAEPSAPERTPKPARRRRTRPGAGFVFLIVLIGIAIQAFVTTGDDESAVAPAERGVTPNMKGVSPPLDKAESLAGAARFESAMASLRSADLGRLTHLRVARDRIDAQLLAGKGRIRIVQISPSLEVRTLATSVTGSRADDSFGYSVIRPRAPQRLARQAARRLGRSPSQVDYWVFSRFAGALQWAVYFRDARHAVGDIDGRLDRVF